MNYHNKKWTLISLLLCISISIYSQDLSVSHNLDESLSLAQQEEKTILMLFSGSDWCKPCIQLRKNILETPTFTQYANDNLIILELDFPYSKKNKLSKEQTEHNESLAETYNAEGSFPKMILLDKNQNTLGPVPYRKKHNTHDLIDEINQIIGL